MSSDYGMAAYALSTRNDPVWAPVDGVPLVDWDDDLGKTGVYLGEVAFYAVGMGLAEKRRLLEQLVQYVRHPDVAAVPVIAKPGWGSFVPASSEEAVGLMKELVDNARRYGLRNISTWSSPEKPATALSAWGVYLRGFETQK